MNTALTRERALEALKKYNREPFHILHALTVEGVMRWFAQDQGYGEETDFWGIAGLLHDIDFEMYPEQHCVKAPELLKEAGVEDELIHAVCSHGYGLVSDVKPEHQMEKDFVCVGRANGPDWGCGQDASVRERNGHGGVQP